MKFFIDGYGVVAQSIIRKLLEMHKLKPNLLFSRRKKNN